MHPLSLLTSTNIVLLFHRVPSTQWFNNILTIIGKIYNFISLDDIESYFYDNKVFNNCCHICFDDGDRTVFDHAFPVLKKMNIPATIFVSPKIIEQNTNFWFQELDYIRNTGLTETLIKKMIFDVTSYDHDKLKNFNMCSIFKSMKIKDILLTIDLIKQKYAIRINEKYNITKRELIEMNYSKLITIGAHTLNHPILNNETEKVAQKEIMDSINKLRDMINKDIKSFAYPNGTQNLDFSSREQIILKMNNIKLSFSTDSAFFNKSSNPFIIPRSGISEFYGENKNIYVYSKLFLMPVWEMMQQVIRKKSRIEMSERKQILEMGGL